MEAGHYPHHLLAEPAGVGETNYGRSSSQPPRNRVDDLVRAFLNGFVRHVNDRELPLPKNLIGEFKFFDQFFGLGIRQIRGRTEVLLAALPVCDKLSGLHCQANDPAMIDFKQDVRWTHTVDQRDVRHFPTQGREIHAQRRLAHARHPGKHYLSTRQFLDALTIVMRDGKLDRFDTPQVMLSQFSIKPWLPERRPVKAALEGTQQRSDQIDFDDPVVMSKVNERLAQFGVH